MIATSMAISMAARIHEKRLMLMHVPVDSLAQPVQKNGIGVHWKIIAQVFAIPKHPTMPIRVQEDLLTKTEAPGKTRI